MKVYIYWLGVFLSIIFTAKLHGLELRALIQPVSLITVYLPVLLYLLVNPIKYSYKEGVNRLIKNESREEDIYFLSKISSITLLSGVVGMVFGMIKMLGNLSDAAALGSGVAAFTMSLLYAVFPLILIAVVEKKISVKQNATILTFTFSLLLGQFFMVLYALSSHA